MNKGEISSENRCRKINLGNCFFLRCAHSDLNCTPAWPGQYICLNPCRRHVFDTYSLR